MAKDGYNDGWKHFSSDPTENPGAGVTSIKPTHERSPVKVYGRPNATGNEELRNPMKLGTKSGMYCQAADRGSRGHSGDATHVFSVHPDYPESDVAVCQAHLPKLISNAITEGNTKFSHRAITPHDVAPLKALAAIHSKEHIAPYENMLRATGATGAEARIGKGADAEKPGQGGKRYKGHLEEVTSRRTPEQQDKMLSDALETVRVHGGRTPKVEPTASPIPAPPKFDERGRIYTFPKKTGPRTTPKEAPAKENPSVSKEEISKMPVHLAAVARTIAAERKSKGIPATGTPIQGGFKPGAKRDEKNRPIAVSAPKIINKAVPLVKSPDALESFIERRASKQATTSASETAASTESKRLRGIEAKKSEHQGVKPISRSAEFTGGTTAPAAKITKGGTMSGTNPDIEAQIKKLLGE